MQNTNEQLASLVVKLQQGESGAFESIYNLTREQAYFTALKISKKEEDAEDILQDAYVYMLEKIGTLDKPESFKSWFNQIVANKAKDLMRKNHPERYTSEFFTNEQGEEVSKFDLMEDDDKDFIPDASVENTELCSEVMKMIDSLSDEKRAAVILYYYDEMTTREIAESLGVNENTVKSRLVQAKKDLAKSVTEYEKKHGKLLGIAPMPLVIWALKFAASGAASASAASGAAAATLAAVTAGTAAGTAAAGAGTAAGAGIATKIIAGIVAASIVGGGAVAGTRAVKKYRETKMEETTVNEAVEDVTDAPVNTPVIEEKDDDTIYIIPKDKKKVDTDIQDVDFGFGVTGYVTRYTVKTENGTEVREYYTLNRKNFSAAYSDLLPSARENSRQYSSQINTVLSGINSERSGYAQLQQSDKLSEQAAVRAEEIAMSGINLNVRPDGSSYKTVFEQNGYTSGGRKEIIAAGCSSPEDALKKITGDKNKNAVSDPLVTEIGIGAAKDPETNKYIYVVHLYSPLGSDEDEDLSKQETGFRVNSILENIKAGNYEGAENISDFLENTPVLRKLSKIDIPIDEFYMFVTDRLTALYDSTSQ